MDVGICRVKAAKILLTSIEEMEDMLSSTVLKLSAFTLIHYLLLLQQQRLALSLVNESDVTVALIFTAPA